MSSTRSALGAVPSSPFLGQARLSEARTATGWAGHDDGMAKTTWQPHQEHGELDTSDRRRLPDSAYAFPAKRREPLTDASHVRNAVARFDQVEGVTDEERVQAFANIKKAAEHYQVDVSADRWQDLGKAS
jgi:hypothetical protein